MSFARASGRYAASHVRRLSLPRENRLFWAARGARPIKICDSRRTTIHDLPMIGSIVRKLQTPHGTTMDSAIEPCIGTNGYEILAALVSTLISPTSSDYARQEAKSTVQ